LGGCSSHEDGRGNVQTNRTITTIRESAALVVGPIQRQQAGHASVGRRRFIRPLPAPTILQSVKKQKFTIDAPSRGFFRSQKTAIMATM
jgi:hypothetical protein